MPDAGAVASGERTGAPSGFGNAPASLPASQGQCRTWLPVSPMCAGGRTAGTVQSCSPSPRDHGRDADPSIGLFRKKNTGKCFVCDSRSWSTIDLVMFVRRCDLREAITWITARYSVPSLPKGSHIEQREEWSPRFRASDTDSVLETLVLSGLWSELANAQRSILGALMTFCKLSRGTARISYRGLMRYSGVKSQATIASALRLFRQMGFLHIEGGSRRRTNPPCEPVCSQF